MIIELDIPDGSPELEELQYVVAHVNSVKSAEAAAVGKPSPVPITLNEYVAPIVLAHFKKRVKNIYIEHARGKSTAELKTAFGNLNKVRR